MAAVHTAGGDVDGNRGQGRCPEAPAELCGLRSQERVASLCMIRKDSTEAPGSTLSTWLLLLYAALNLYLLGGALMLQAVQYPLLGEVSAASLPALHAAFSRRLGGVFVLPEFLAFLGAIPLLRLRPPSVPAWSVWACLLSGAAYFIVTFGWHLPLHRLLARGDASASVMASLLISHGVRTASLALKCGLLLWMLKAALSNTTQSARSR